MYQTIKHSTCLLDDDADIVLHRRHPIYIHVGIWDSSIPSLLFYHLDSNPGRNAAAKEILYSNVLSGGKAHNLLHPHPGTWLSSASIIFALLRQDGISSTSPTCCDVPSFITLALLPLRFLHNHHHLWLVSSLRTPSRTRTIIIRLSLSPICVQSTTPRNL